MRFISFHFLNIFLVSLPLIASAESIGKSSTFVNRADECTEGVRVQEDGTLILSCNSHERCGLIVAVKDGEGVALEAVAEKEVEEADGVICLPDPDIKCDGESCECVPFGRLWNDGKPLRFCRCLSRSE